jgi:hypothetical protein
MSVFRSSRGLATGPSMRLSSRMTESFACADAHALVPVVKPRDER